MPRASSAGRTLSAFRPTRTATRSACSSARRPSNAAAPARSSAAVTRRAVPPRHHVPDHRVAPIDPRLRKKPPRRPLHRRGIVAGDEPCPALSEHHRTGFLHHEQQPRAHPAVAGVEVWNGNARPLQRPGVSRQRRDVRRLEHGAPPHSLGRIGQRRGVRPGHDRRLTTTVTSGFLPISSCAPFRTARRSASSSASSSLSTFLPARPSAAAADSSSTSVSG